MLNESTQLTNLLICNFAIISAYDMVKGLFYYISMNSISLCINVKLGRDRQDVHRATCAAGYPDSVKREETVRSHT